MKFVAIKSEEQQGVLFLHRARDLIVRQRTQLSNMLRGLLAEFGIVIAQGIGSAIKFAKSVLDGDKPGIPEVAIDVLGNLSNQLVALHLRVRWYEMRMRLQARQDPHVMLLRTVPRRRASDGVGDRRNSRRRQPAQERSRICHLAGPDTAQPVKWRQGKAWTHLKDGGPIYQAFARHGNDLATEADEDTSGTRGPVGASSA